MNGVYDENGKQIIRPLNEAEKAFLNKYYEEEVNANFQHDLSVKAVYREIKDLKSKGYTESDVEIKRLKKKARDLKAKYNLNTTSEQEKALYRKNNERNRCMYNRAKTGNNITALDEESYNTIHKELYANPDVGELALIHEIEDDD